MGKEILFIADDFGLNKEANEAILYSHLQGALHGAALMMGQEGTDSAIALAKQYPSLRVGLHFHWNDSWPTTIRQWPWGSSPVRAGWAIGFSPRARHLVRDEMRAQWQEFQETGLRCDFINSHHHLHLHPVIFPELLKLIQGRFDGWIRAGLPQTFGLSFRSIFSRKALAMIARRARRKTARRTSNTLWGVDRPFRMNAEEISRAVAALPDGLHEFIFHPRKKEGDADVDCLLTLRTLIREGEI